MSKTMTLTLQIWRQRSANTPGSMQTYKLEGVNEHMSFLEMLDVLNTKLTKEGQDPVAFDHDCREGICGSCAMVIDGRPHGPRKGTTACQLHMRTYKDGDTITIEPWRAKAFPVIKDLVVDRGALDRIVAAGGFVSVNTGVTVDANAIPVGKKNADEAMDYAACIGCGACVAACPNASAMLFTGAKVGHLVKLPQGQVERRGRVLRMVEQMDREGFGACTNHRECSEACPKEISFDAIELLNREYMRAQVTNE
ncbi:succinate dehydrogenase / fumarate reductase iron-sulfur subunit [Nannocystis exedens]|uniref:succinate dehydrogenase n=2 Tax=Nannocystis exedens TaxID=54 RepID=A0A1I1SM16_9BACT|nr:succinate dehydrogenase [Nannocystis exedens]SFD47524.1 succinate dehydrogenase / fumarate reductase iron-sulfur subunit [Nannocystis exedens]